jgi:pyruvate dehydrogenase E2 component (dihydrolipoamide acetyltransferase)
MRYKLVLPDLGLEDQPIILSLWLVDRGMHVAEGEQIVELLAGDAVVDLPSPGDGVLLKRLVREGETVRVGQRLAIIQSEDEE